MNFKEAIQEAINGEKVREASWDDKSYLYFKEDGSIGLVYRGAYCSTFELTNTGMNTKWEIYKEKKTFYRRKWVHFKDSVFSTIDVGGEFYSSKEAHDRVMKSCENIGELGWSDEWETIEI